MWLKLAEKTKLFYHATIPEYADSIEDMQKIISSLKYKEMTGRSISGWNFQDDEIYGYGIYLSNDKELAIYYGFIRLKNYWKELLDSDIDPTNDEDNFYIALFTTYVEDPSEIKQLSSEKEFITTSPTIERKNNKIQFSGPEWINMADNLKQEFSWLFEDGEE